MEVTLEEVAGWAGVSLASGGPLDEKITDKHILQVCAFITDWESVASYLGVTPSALEEIRADNPNTRKRREAMLRRWKASQGQGATYRELGAVFLKLNKAQDACEVFKLSKYREDG